MTLFERALSAKFTKYRKYYGERGLEYVVECPFCDSGKGYDKLYINPSKRVGYCHREGKAWSLFDILAVSTNVLDTAENTTHDIVKREPPSPGACVAINQLNESHEAIKWLKARQPSNSWTIDELSPEYNVVYCYNGSVISRGFNTTNTIIFNFYKHSKLVGWQARLLYNPKELNDDDPRKYYLNDVGNEHIVNKCYTSPGLGGPDKIYNYDNACKYKLVVITEGPFDAIAVGKFAIAVCGKSISSQQLRAIAATWEYAIVLFDKGANKDSNKAKRKIEQHIPTCVATLEEADDPGSADRYYLYSTIIDACSNDSRFKSLFKNDYFTKIML